MTLDGYQVDMRNKTWTCWIFFAGFVLSLGVARDCISFKEHITDELLLDHWFEIRYFQHPDETVTDGYTLLSILNIMCTSLKKYGHRYDNDSDSRYWVKLSYRLLVNKILNLKSEDDSLAACERHACNSSFSKSYISPDELEKEYHKVCAWNGTLPACPSPNSPTSNPSHTTTHQSTSTTTSSSSQPRNMTSPSASNNTETLPACQPTSSKNCTENSGNMQENRADEIPENTKEKNVFLSLLTVSCTVNVALIMLVLWQCRNRRLNNLQDYSEEYHHYHNVELVYLRSEKKNQSEGNHQLPSEFTFLRNREQSEDNVNSSYSTT